MPHSVGAFSEIWGPILVVCERDLRQMLQIEIAQARQKLTFDGNNN